MILKGKEAGGSWEALVDSSWIGGGRIKLINDSFRIVYPALASVRRERMQMGLIIQPHFVSASCSWLRSPSYKGKGGTLHHLRTFITELDKSLRMRGRKSSRPSRGRDSPGALPLSAVTLECWEPCRLPAELPERNCSEGSSPLRVEHNKDC